MFKQNLFINITKKKEKQKKEQNKFNVYPTN